MSRRDYNRGAARGFAADSRRVEAEDRHERASQRQSGPRIWHRVIKNGIVLYFSRSLDMAKRHADKCGGKVVSSMPRK